MIFTPRVRSLAPILVSAIVAISAAMTNRLAQAEIIFSGTHFDLQISSPIDVGDTMSLKAVPLTAVGKNGATPYAFDGVSNGHKGITTPLTSPALYQIKQPYIDEFGETSHISTPTNTLKIPGSIPQSRDTHFLIDEGSYIAVNDPTENNISVFTPLEYPYSGFDSSLTGLFTLTGTGWGTSWNFAYLVVPNGTQVSLDFYITMDVGPPELVNITYQVPEPSVLLLFVTGVFGLLVYVRRRKA